MLDTEREGETERVLRSLFRIRAPLQAHRERKIYGHQHRQATYLPPSDRRNQLRKTFIPMEKYMGFVEGRHGFFFFFLVRTTCTQGYSLEGTKRETTYPLPHNRYNTGILQEELLHHTKRLWPAIVTWC